MTRFDPTVFGSIWGENFGQSQARQLQREAMDRAYGNDEFNQKMATDQFGLAKDHLALQQQQAADNYVLQQQQRQSTLEAAEKRAMEILKRKEVHSKLLRAMLSPVVQAPGAQDINYDPSQFPMDTVPNGVGPPAPRTVDVGGWDQRQSQALQNAQGLVTDEDLMFADPSVVDTYRRFLIDQQGVQAEMKGALADFNGSRQSGNAKYLYDHHAKELGRFPGLRDLLGPDETPEHITQQEQLAREQERGPILQAMGAEPGGPDWQTMVGMSDDEFAGAFMKWKAVQQKTAQQQALQQQARGSFIASGMSPEEADARIAADRAGLTYAREPNRTPPDVAEPMRKRINDLDSQIKMLETQLTGKIDPFTGKLTDEVTGEGIWNVRGSDYAPANNMAEQLAALKQEREATYQALNQATSKQPGVTGGRAALTGSAPVSQQAMQLVPTGKQLRAQFKAQSGREPSPQELADLLRQQTQAPPR